MLQFDSSMKIEQSLKSYDQAWQALPEMKAVRPTTLSIKVADKAALFSLLQQNAAEIEQLHIGTVNDRYIASAALHDSYEGLTILKVLERRPGSSDPLGLDSLDYLVGNLESSYQGLRALGLNVEKEHNDVHAWLSLRFGDSGQFEAKFTDHLVLEVAIKELRLASQAILRPPSA